MTATLDEPAPPLPPPPRGGLFDRDVLSRARDLLLLSGREASTKVETWRQWIDRALPDCAGLLRVLPDIGGNN